jgi:septal ring factor EnvC (AmiA/AmiB activator)
MPSIDLWIAIGLLLVVVLVFVASRVGIVPSKSIPVVAGAVFGALGFMMFASWRRRASDAQIKELKRRIDERDAALTDAQKARLAADQKLAAEHAQLDSQLEAMKKERLRIANENAAEKARIDAMTRTEVNDAFDRLIAAPTGRPPR